jgi:hypothetical protein
VLVQKSVTTITNAAGRLSGLDARESLSDAQEASCKKLAFRLPAVFSCSHSFPAIVWKSLTKNALPGQVVITLGGEFLHADAQKAAQAASHLESNVTFVFQEIF